MNTNIDVAKFKRLADKWKRETSVLSDSTKIAMHPAYQEIIAMGTDVLPLIFERLLKYGEDWFCALMILTDADPVPNEYCGNIPKMRALWLEWAVKKGIIDPVPNTQIENYPDYYYPDNDGDD